MTRHTMVALGVARFLLAPSATAAQAVLDVRNDFPNVGVLMVWRVDQSGKPVELRGHASGTLIHEKVMITAGHFTAPAKALGVLPPSLRIFASFSPADAKNPDTWIPVTALVTHPSMPHCPPPPQCDPTDDLLVAPLEPGIADLGLVILEWAPPGIEPARLAAPGSLERDDRTDAVIVGYGTTNPASRGVPPDTARWDAKRRLRMSTLRKVVDETWTLWSIPSFVCSGDSGGGIFLHSINGAPPELVANVSDGGRDCRRHNNNVRLDTETIQHWIRATIRRQVGGM